MGEDKEDELEIWFRRLIILEVYAGVVPVI